MTVKPRYLKAKWNGWDTVIGRIEDYKELAAWLTDGSLEEGDTVYEVKTMFKVRKWKNEKLVLTEEKVGVVTQK